MAFRVPFAPAEEPSFVMPPQVRYPDVPLRLNNTPYELVVVIHAHSDYEARAIEPIRMPDGKLQSTIRIANIGVYSFGTPSKLGVNGTHDLANLFMPTNQAQASYFGSPLTDLLAATNLEMKTKCDTKPKRSAFRVPNPYQDELEEFVTCTGVISKYPEYYRNRVYDFYEVDKQGVSHTVGGVTLYCNQLVDGVPTVTKVDLYVAPIRNGRFRLTKQRIIEDITRHEILGKYTHMVIIDLGCSKSEVHIPDIDVMFGGKSRKSRRKQSRRRK